MKNSWCLIIFLLLLFGVQSSKTAVYVPFCPGPHPPYELKIPDFAKTRGGSPSTNSPNPEFLVRLSVAQKNISIVRNGLLGGIKIAPVVSCYAASSLPSEVEGKSEGGSVDDQESREGNKSGCKEPALIDRVRVLPTYGHVRTRSRSADLSADRF